MQSNNHIIANPLAESIKQVDRALWLIDEASSDFCFDAGVLGTTEKLSNRFDLAKKFNAVFNDFLIAETFANQKLDLIAFRISKEKQINLHVFNSWIDLCSKSAASGLTLASASTSLPSSSANSRAAISTSKTTSPLTSKPSIPTPTLKLFGAKNEGIKSLFTLAKEQLAAFGNAVTLQLDKIHKQVFVISIHFTDNSVCSGIEANQVYKPLQLLSLSGVEFYSKPGLFGWQKIDQGSSLLISTIAQYYETKSDNTLSSLQALDLGCGYGYLSIRLKQLGFTHIDATDNCAAALLSCEENFKHYDIKGQIIASDAADSISKSYNVIVCNPPFHQGFDHVKSSTELFTEAAARHLKPGGEAWFVVNQFVG
ncbi:MAG: methyltransferase, partial [Pseudomonadales bacterium]|nr:methyltransferase [Pseudomonadales bacterium]